MIWRVLGIVLNPFAAIVWWIARKIGGGIDRVLGPVVGWYAAILLMLLSLLSVATVAYLLLPTVSRHIGLFDPPPITTVQGTVLSVETENERRLTIRQLVTVGYRYQERSFSFSESVTEPITDKHEVGEVVTVYLEGGEQPTIEDPNDPVKAFILAGIGMVGPLLLLLGSWLFLRHRRRIYSARPVKPVQDHFGERVLSTAERLKADEQRFRQMTARKSGK